MKCLNCPISENEYGDIENNEIVNDSTSTIIYDENGVLIKKEIKEVKEEVQNVKIEIDTKKETKTK